METFNINLSTSNEVLPRPNGGKREEGVDAEAEIVERSAEVRKVNISNTSKGRETVFGEVDVQRSAQGKEQRLEDGLTSIRVHFSPSVVGET